MVKDRRNFLKALGAGALATAFPPSIHRALAIPANRCKGTIADVEHIVIFMQENRSFDHYFGTLRGVRGFADPRAVRLPSGASVFEQPSGAGAVLPFHPTAPNLGLQFLQDLPHGWPDTHAAWNEGRYDAWIPNKSATTMAYLTRADIPYHYALADAFTVCDAYYCSFMGATDPNRYHMWTGWVGNDGKNGGPVLDNAEKGYDWSTYPERLERNGISWKIYQDKGEGLDAAHYWGWGSNAYIGNYGDNSLLYFHQYQNAAPGTPLFDRARSGTDVSKGGTLFDDFRADVLANKLPQVTWIVAPEAYTEHPNWPANYGAWYTAQLLDALTANPDVWSRTALFLTYDENDGFFDHMIPPTPPQSRAHGLSTVDVTTELCAGDAKYAAGPYGLGVRVPMIVISPWSKGGFVNSQVFDHTSLIRFIEARFAGGRRDLIESNITPWRRAVAGDLTSAFNFASPNATLVSLPATAGYQPPDAVNHPDYVPTPPANGQLPKQEPGMRKARALPYVLDVECNIDLKAQMVELRFVNRGAAAAVFHVRAAGANAAGPWSYTVEPRRQLVDRFPIAATGYDLSVYAPNGFMRRYQGGGASGSVNLAVATSYDEGPGITLELRGDSPDAVPVSILDVYSRTTLKHAVVRGKPLVRNWSLNSSYGWYDFIVEVESDRGFRRELAGHVENGRDSMSDPLLGK